MDPKDWLRTHEFLLLDFQTTGMRPSVGQILEFAWAFARADESWDDRNVRSFVIRLPEGETLLPRVRELTGLSEDDLKTGHDLASVFEQFTAELKQRAKPVRALIHYAQFEKPFLTDLFTRFGQTPELPFEIICTHQLVKRLVPQLPSSNIRGAAGFFGGHADQVQRAHGHVRATHQIWQGVCAELAKQELHTLADLEQWRAAKPKTLPKARYEYRIDKLKRLELPNQPGIYRMISKRGEVLYVGKATSLKSRVNSYFRGQKNRDRRKLEMLAQVWDLQVTPCLTPLEAALLESDEIKALNPRYNVVLKRGRRHLLFYNREFTKASAEPSREMSFGPFRNHNWIEHLRALVRSLAGEAQFEQVFYDPVPVDLIRAGWELYLNEHRFNVGPSLGVRRLLAMGFLRARRVKEEDVVEEEKDEAEWTAADVAGKFDRLLRRAAHEWRRAKKMTKFLNSQITLDLKTGPHILKFLNGRLSSTATNKSEVAWHGLAIDDFDRMSIVVSELEQGKYTYRVDFLG